MYLIPVSLLVATNFILKWCYNFMGLFQRTILVTLTTLGQQKKNPNPIQTSLSWIAILQLAWFYKALSVLLWSLQCDSPSAWMDTQQEQLWQTCLRHHFHWTAKIPLEVTSSQTLECMHKATLDNRAWENNRALDIYMFLNWERKTGTWIWVKLNRWPF